MVNSHYSMRAGSNFTDTVEPPIKTSVCVEPTRCLNMCVTKCRQNFDLIDSRTYSTITSAEGKYSSG